jgi:hypothetical protein
MCNLGFLYEVTKRFTNCFVKNSRAVLEYEIFFESRALACEGR